MLIDRYKEISYKRDEWCYFTSQNPDLMIDTVFKKNEAYKFIKEYLQNGRKEQLIPLSLSDFRANHTVSAYLLGINIRNSLHINMISLPKLSNKPKRNFLYFWSLICLCHDFGYVLEENSLRYINKCKNIDSFCSHFDIKYNLLEVIDNKSLLKDYYFYMINEKMIIDHGIAGSIILYDKLVKLYEEAKRSEGINENVSFLHDGLRFSSEYKRNCQKVASTIANHNLWRAMGDNIDTYKKYNLHDLIPNANETHLLKFEKKNNLIYMLGLIDTIEALKILQINIKSKYKILNSVDIVCNYKKMLIIIICPHDYVDIYYKKVSELTLWLNVTVKMSEKGSIQVYINKEF